MNRQNNRTQIIILQILADVICLASTYTISILLMGAIFHYHVSFSEYLWIPVLFGMVYTFTMFISEMYLRSTFTYQDRTLRYVMKSCLWAAIFCLVMMPFTANNNFALYILLIYIITAIILISIQYLTVQELRQAMGKRWRKRAILIGLKENMQEYTYYIRKTSFQIDVVGFICLDKSDPPDENYLGTIDFLSSIIRENVIDEIIFAIPGSLLEYVRPYVLQCKDRGLTVRLAVDFFEDQDRTSYIHSVGTIPVFTYESSTLNDIQYLLKRGVDIIGALIGLCFTIFASVFIIPSLLFKSENSIFRQREYCSVNGRTFTLYTFRTIPEKNKILRRTSMDNLPMFWNVLKGDMSLVGSLPIPATNINILTNNNQLKNITLKPGLTGNWRFVDRGRLEDNSFMKELNMKYLNRWSFIRDFWIIIKTIVVLLTSKSTDLRATLFTSMEEKKGSYGMNSIS